jgi:hypothetical protein
MGNRSVVIEHSIRPPLFRAGRRRAHRRAAVGSRPNRCAPPSAQRAAPKAARTRADGRNHRSAGASMSGTIPRCRGSIPDPIPASPRGRNPTRPGEERRPKLALFRSCPLLAPAEAIPTPFQMRRQRSMPPQREGANPAKVRARSWRTSRSQARNEIGIQARLKTPKAANKVDRAKPADCRIATSAPPASM